MTQPLKLTSQVIKGTDKSMKRSILRLQIEEIEMIKWNTAAPFLPDKVIVKYEN